MAVQRLTAAVGDAAPGFTLTDQHGSDFRLADSLSTGPAVVVNRRGFT